MQTAAYQLSWLHFGSPVKIRVSLSPSPLSLSSALYLFWLGNTNWESLSDFVPEDPANGKSTQRAKRRGDKNYWTIKTVSQTEDWWGVDDGTFASHRVGGMGAMWRQRHGYIKRDVELLIAITDGEVVSLGAAIWVYSHQLHSNAYFV